MYLVRQIFVFLRRILYLCPVLIYKHAAKVVIIFNITKFLGDNFQFMAKIIQNIEQIIAQEGITVGQFERSIGASKAVISRAIANGTDIQSKWISAIVENYPQYSPAWLVTGVGNMFNDSTGVPHGAADPTIAQLVAQITEQAETIGALKEQIKQLQREKGKDVSDVLTSGVANAV